MTVTSQISGKQRMFNACKRRRGCSTARRICTVCRTKKIDKRDVNYEKRICFTCDANLNLASQNEVLATVVASLTRGPTAPAPPVPGQASPDPGPELNPEDEMNGYGRDGDRLPEGVAA